MFMVVGKVYDIVWQDCVRWYESLYMEMVTIIVVYILLNSA